MMIPVSKPKVAVFTLGGTIAMARDASGGIVPSLSGAQLLSAVPGLAEAAEVTVDSPVQLPSASLIVDQLRDVARRVEAALAQGATGAVVVQGTDAIEESAFVLDLLLQTDRPVVITGAMRGPEAAGADGPANLLAAVTVAASSASDIGVVVVLNNTVHAARFVRKGHTSLPSAFVSDPAGPLGHVIEGRFQTHWQVPRRPRLRLNEAAPIPPVALLTVGMGDDARLIDALPGLGFEGVVIAAMGAGHVPGILAEPLGALAGQMPVVLSTRVASGPIARNTYGYPGSEIDLLARGLIRGGTLGALKARLLLQLSLASGHCGTEALQSLFDDHE